MSAFTSLGTHQPAGLRQLDTEYPSTSKSLDYAWNTYIHRTAEGPVEEEVLYTRACVVWSQAGLVRAVHRFELEQEDVRRAFLTTFSAASIHAVSKDAAQQPASQTQDRALVVLLQTKLHVYYLHGAHHVIDLPFPVLDVLPAPRGIIFSRSKAQLTPIPQTPKPLVAPPNSFFSSQHSLRTSYLQSPTLQRRFGRTDSQATLTGDTGINLEDLWQSTFGNATPTQVDEEDIIFTLADPLSEPGLVTEAQRSPVLRLTGRSKHPISIDFDSLDPAERLVYISPRDELDNADNDRAALVIMVTTNTERGTTTLWHGWYLNEKSLLDLMKKRNDAKAEKARRRSSFLSASMGTGTTTPAVRNRDILRDSFAALSQSAGQAIRSVHDEVVLASQLDPDYASETMQQSTKTVSRRISSIVSRTDAPGTSSIGASFGGTSFRRGPSYGGAVERRSLGLRRSRGSTPGSVLSRSFGIDDDDSMDFDNGSEFDLDETVSETLQLVRATHDAVGAETLLGTLEGGWRRDFVISRLHSFTSQSTTGSPEAIKVVTLKQSPQCVKSEDDMLSIYVHDRECSQLMSCSLQVKHRKLYPELSKSTYAAIPVIKSYNVESMAGDIIKLSDDDMQAVLTQGTHLRFAGSDIVCPVAALGEHRLTNPFASLPSSPSTDTGKSRLIKKPEGLTGLDHASIEGRFSQKFADESVQRQSVRLRPVDQRLDSILAICEIVLPHEMAIAIRPTWLTMHQALIARPALLTGTNSSAEAIAVAATVFAQSLGLLDKKNKAALRLSRVAATKQQGRPHGATLEQRRSQAFMNMRALWSRLGAAQAPENRDHAAPIAIALADETSTFSEPLGFSQNALINTKLILGLHILSEESKLNCCDSSSDGVFLGMIIAQLGLWLNIDSWSSTSGSYYDLGGATSSTWAFVKTSAYRHQSLEIMEKPIGVCEWLEHSIAYQAVEQYPTLSQIAQLGLDITLPPSFLDAASKLTTRINMLSDLLKRTATLTGSSISIVEAMQACGMTADILETLPEGIAAPLKEAVTQCEREPPGSWKSELLQLVGREDLVTGRPSIVRSASTQTGPHDIHTVCATTELPSTVTKTREASRNATSQLIFSEDRRLVDATTMLHYNTVQVAECQKQPDWTDTHYFEQQKRVMQFVTIRMIALPVGDGILHFNSQNPLMTEKYHLAGFSSSCIMQPGGHTVTTDRNGLTEEKVNWAYFHAGVAAGLRISKHATGIDTSWLVFNKPTELTNRHAGLLLALGLNGHLKQLAKWLSFKYLTPKHTMTSLGLLLGLAASYIGSMDSLITRMLSVHISCMLPPGAAELNVSPHTQTAGLMGIGLLYYNTQHRRMTETMLQEIETAGVDDPDCGPHSIKDESYRLAAGFALGFINLGHGRSLHGLSGLGVQERLLRVAIGSRPVNTVHVMDQATAGAIMGLALVYMKTRDTAIARQIDVPDTEAQFEHVRPDILMLRTLAKHVILWDTIEATKSKIDQVSDATWVASNLPKCHKSKWREASNAKTSLKSSDLPFYYIATGLALAMSLKYAGSGHRGARNEILAVLDRLWSIQRKRADGHHYYDTKIARSAARRCIDVLALAAATVMAGTGDILTFRYLRRLHGRTDAETPYGSHLASHMGIGILFMGGGTYTFGTSDLAIASLVVSLYPLFPIDVHDNKVHLQAFRHLWVFAVEQRCLIVEDVDIGRPIQMPITVTLKDGHIQQLQSPCILPDLGTIAIIATADPSYWRVTLDFKHNPEHLRRFKEDQRLSVRRCPASEAYDNAFWATVSALTIVPKTAASISICEWVWALSAFQTLDKSDIDLVARADERSIAKIAERGTRVDDRLVLRSSASSNDRDRLWEVRVLLAWAKRLSSSERAKSRWLGSQALAVIEHDINGRRRDVAKK